MLDAITSNDSGFASCKAKLQAEIDKINQLKDAAQAAQQTDMKTTLDAAGSGKKHCPENLANLELNHGTAVARIYDKLQSSSLAMNGTLELLWQKIEEVQASSEGT